MTQTPVRIYRPGMLWIALPFGLLAPALLVAGVWFLVTPASSPGMPPANAAIVGTTFIVMGLFALCVMIPVIPKAVRPQWLIDDRGITDLDIPSRPFIPWSEVVSVEPPRGYPRHGVGIQLRTPEVYLAQLTEADIRQIKREIRRQRLYSAMIRYNPLKADYVDPIDWRAIHEPADLIESRYQALGVHLLVPALFGASKPMAQIEEFRRAASARRA
jgi:hypothetical protein